MTTQISPSENVSLIDRARDSRLVSRAVAGDTAAVNKLITRHDPRVQRICRAVLRNHHDAQDAAQEAWTRIIRSLSRFHGDDLSAWISTIARNEAYRFAGRRAKAPVPVEELPPVADISGDPLTAAIAAEINAALMKAVESLEGVQREVAVRDLAGQSPAEIAEVLEITPGACRVRTHRARRRIQQHMEGTLAA